MVVEPQPWDEDNQMPTATGKKRRARLLERYQAYDETAATDTPTGSGGLPFLPAALIF